LFCFIFFISTSRIFFSCALLLYACLEGEKETHLHPLEANDNESAAFKVEHDEQQVASTLRTRPSQQQQQR
jgi:hypothetical protein